MTEMILTDADGNTLRSGINVGGIVTPDPLMDPARNKRIFDAIPGFKFRDDDIMLCTFPKCGTHWTFEILNMIISRSSERVKTLKYMSMIEYQTQEYIDGLESPRVVNSHLRPSLLPKSLGTQKIKTILCLRNPKDVAVSFYHHIVGLTHYRYTGTFEAWLPLYLEGNLEDGKYTDYLLDWEREITKGLDYPLHVLFYEDLKLDTGKELNKLLQFLNIELDTTLKNGIIEACSFDKMSKEKPFVSPELSDEIIRKGFHFFRKGEIGDWKNMFTVAQNTMFDKTWKKEMENSKRLKIYHHVMTEVILTDADGNKLRSGIDVGGIITPDSTMSPDRNKRIFDELQSFTFRDDDIMLCTFPKCGTNWMYEVLTMIKNKSCARVTSYKLMSMLECRTQECFDALESPRVINSHLRPSLLPKGINGGKIKTILCLRNPKDVATSFYHHIVGHTHYGYTGTFKAWLPLYLEGNLEDGKYPTTFWIGREQ